MDNLNAVFAALSDPTRRSLLERLALGESTVGELAAPFKMTPPAVSRHLKVLEAANLIERERDGQYIRLRLNRKAFSSANTWLLEQSRD